jgi:hypothetical protein
MSIQGRITPAILLAFVVVVAVSIVAAVVSTTLLRPAEAQTSSTEPGTLTGERLGGSPVNISGTCNAEGESTFTFTTSGFAAGLYTGTFTANGSITVSGSQVIAFSENFTIVSPGADPNSTEDDTTISGTKTITEPIPNSIGSNTALCPTGGPLLQAGVSAEYEATITSPSGTFKESGTSEILISQSFFHQGFLTAERQPSEPETPTPTTVELNPEAAINPVGTEHTVTATVKDESGNPVEGATVEFRVTGAVTTEGECTTDADGQCDFTFQGPEFPGATEITAFVDIDNPDNEPNTQDPLEPFAVATKVFILPESTPGQVTGGGYIGSPINDDKVAFGFTAKSETNEDDSDDVKGRCSVIDKSTQTEIKCLDVTNLVQTPTEEGGKATFFGNAEVKIGSGEEATTHQVTYRIDVDDLAEPGKGKDTFKIQTDSGYVASGILQGGNIQVHSQ